MVIFDTGKEAKDPADLARLLRSLPASTVYYHLIDARHRPPTGTDDFQRWLEGWGEAYEPLVEALQAVDVYFTPLPALREEIIGLFEQHTTGVAA